MNDISGFILAGGESRRMGKDKSHLVIDGENFVERIARELTAVTSSVSVVGSTARAAFAQPSLSDIFPKWGALGGVHGALAACKSDWALIVACDFPFVTSALFARLIRSREDFDAVAPVQEDNIPQPLCSLYKVDACLVRAEQLIKSGERKPIALLQSVNTRWVAFNELRDLAGAESFFDNINTPEDYRSLVEKGAGPN